MNENTSLNYEALVKISIELDLFLRDIPEFKGTDCDVFDTMAYYFLGKQLEHHRAFLALYSKESTDVFLINRSMIEGYAMLNYAATDKPKLASDWCAYWPLSRFIELRGYQALDVAEFNTEIQEIETYVNNRMAGFLNPKGKWPEVCGKTYYAQWYKQKSITEMVRELRSKLLTSNYARCCNWHHWNPIGAKETLKLDRERFADFKALSPSIKNSIGVSFNCLINTAYIVVNHFGKGEASEKLMGFNDRFCMANSEDTV